MATKNQKNKLSEAISEFSIKAIKKDGLDVKKPFAELSENAVRNAFKNAAGKTLKS